jgi:thioesterase domain-containing protein
MAAQMLHELERLTGSHIPSSLMLEATTIRQLAGMLTESRYLNSEPLVELSSSGHRLPLMFFHGDYNGGGFYAARLAHLLGPDQPLFVIAPHGVDGGPIPNSIEAMATDRLDLVLQAQPDGPYQLYGYCLGGIVAMEVARILIAKGKQVETVGIIDPPTVNAHAVLRLALSALSRLSFLPDTSRERAKAWLWYKCARLQRVWNKPLSQQFEWIRSKILAFMSRKNAQSDISDEHGLGSFTDKRTFEYSVAMSNYLPDSIDVPVTFFVAEQNAEPWRKIASRLDVVKLPNDHGQVIAAISNLAEHLEAQQKKH